MAAPKIDPHKAAAAVARWQAEPVTFINEVLGIDLWHKQEDIANSVRDNFFTAVASGHAVGKDYVASAIAVWFLLTHPNSIVLTTAPSERQVIKVLWAEIRAALANAKANGINLGGRLAPSAARYEINDKWFALGFTSKERNAWQGYHSHHVLCVLDEAAGLESWVFEAARSVAVGATSRILCIGNPLCGPTHPFARACKRQPEEGKHNFIRISSTDTPNYVQGKTVIPGLAGREYVEQVAKEEGEHSDAYRASVLGIFPAGSSNSLITMEDLSLARFRTEDRKGYFWGTSKDTVPIRLGVDCARFGDDATVIAATVGDLGQFPAKGKLRKADGPTVAKRINEICQDYAKRGKVLSVAIDEGGVTGPIDSLREMQRRGEADASIDIIGNQFGARATQRQRWANRRTELYDLLRTWFREQGVMACTPEVAEELVAHTYGWRGPAKLLDPKDKVKKAIGRSPDHADALALAVAGHIGRANRIKPWIEVL